MLCNDNFVSKQGSELTVVIIDFYDDYLSNSAVFMKENINHVLFYDPATFV